MVPIVFALLWLHPCRVLFDRVTLWTYGPLKGSQRDDLGCVCVVCASPCGVGVGRRRACPHRRDVGSWYTARCQWCRDRLGHNGPASLCVCGSRGCPTHNGYPRGSGRLGRMRVRFGRISWCICVVAVMGHCDRWVGTAWRHTPVIHDDPDCPPSRDACTLTGPSPILRCGFGKGTPLIAAEPLSWVSPCLTSCCLCRGA